MKAIKDRCGALRPGLAAIRAQFRLPDAFGTDVLEAANAAAAGPRGARADLTALPFVTLDPISATDLDQAFAIEAAGTDLLLHYAIADVAAFLTPGDPVDREAWARGETFYLPDGRIGLYPPVISEGAASLLPDGPRPAIRLAVRVAPDGGAALDAVDRVTIRSRAKLGYATVSAADLPPMFFDLARRVQAAEAARGAARIDPPQQQVVEETDGRFALGFRPMSAIEQANAAMSLAANLAVADALHAAGTGLFRVMRAPGHRAVDRLRLTARALGLDWPSGDSLAAFEARLDPNRRADAAFMLAVRRAGQGASYAPYDPGERPFHAAIAATYAHATAPLRRLADRFVLEAALALANGRPVPDAVAAAFGGLAPVMNRAESRAAQVDSAVVELAEAVVLETRVGERFTGQVIDLDDRGARVQLCAEPVVTRVDGEGLTLGEGVELKLVEASPARRTTRFEL